MKLPIQLMKNSRQPIYDQIEQQLKALIAGGLLTAGTLLPSIRVLSKDLEVSVITTRRAYQNLEAEGFIETVQGKGTFVKAVDQIKRDEIKTLAVDEAFQEAIQMALHYDYNYEQILERFKFNLNQMEKGE